MRTLLLTPIAATLLLSILYSCNSTKPEQDKSSFYTEGNTVVIPENSILKSKIKTDTVRLQPYRLKLLTAGTVKAIPTQYAEIAPPFAGRVIKSYLKLGMKCTPGTPLFEISSPDFISAQKLFFQAKSQLDQAEKTLKRQKDLMVNGVGTQKDLEEAQTDHEIKKKEYQNALLGIKLFSADPNSLVLGQPLVVRSPIAGEVIENKVVLGQFIKEDAPHVATVAELSKIWIAGQVKEKDIRLIHALEDCQMGIPALPEKHIQGKVYHVEEMVNEETRSIQVLVEANNADHTLKPGMYVTINFIGTPVNSILIPAKAILQMNDASFVFVQTSPGKYVKRKVQTEGTEGDKVIILSGLNAGDVIISEGGFYLLDIK